MHVKFYRSRFWLAKIWISSTLVNLTVCTCEIKTFISDRRYLTLYFCKNMHFHAQAEYSYFSADFKLRIFLIHSEITKHSTRVFSVKYHYYYYNDQRLWISFVNDLSCTFLVIVMLTRFVLWTRFDLRKSNIFVILFNDIINFISKRDFFRILFSINMRKKFLSLVYILRQSQPQYSYKQDSIKKECNTCEINTRWEKLKDTCLPTVSNCYSKRFLLICMQYYHLK